MAQATSDYPPIGVCWRVSLDIHVGLWQTIPSASQRIRALAFYAMAALHIGTTHRRHDVRAGGLTTGVGTPLSSWVMSLRGSVLAMLCRVPELESEAESWHLRAVERVRAYSQLSAVAMAGCSTAAAGQRPSLVVDGVAAGQGDPCPCIVAFCQFTPPMGAGGRRGAV